MGRIFWGMMGLLTAIAVHIAFVLFGPQHLFQAFARGTDFGREVNTLVLLPDAERARLLPALRGPGVAAVCNVDLASGAVRIDLQPPNSYWTLSIYTQDGRQVYSLNDAQANNEKLAIDLVRAKSLKEQVLGKSDEDEDISIIESAAWRVELVDPRAYVVLWEPLSDPLFAADTRDALRASRCGTRKS